MERPGVLRRESQAEAVDRVVQSGRNILNLPTSLELLSRSGPQVIVDSFEGVDYPQSRIGLGRRAIEAANMPTREEHDGSIVFL